MRTPIVCLLIMIASTLLGCARTSREAAVRREFWLYDRVAIWSNLTREQEELFIPLYMAAFPGQTLVERRDLEAVMGEQDLLPERLDDTKRAELREIFGVKAIAFPTSSPGQLAIKVIDAETGVISCSAIVTGSSDKISDAKLIRELIDAIKDHGFKG